MSKKLLRTVGKVAMVVATVAAIGTGIGAVLGGTMMLAIGGMSIAASAIAGAASLISIGASMLSKPKAPSIGAANQDRLNVSLNVHAPRVMAFGDTALATDLRDQEFTGADKEFLHRFFVNAAHRLNAIREIWFDDKIAWTLAGGVQGEFAGYLTVTPVLEGGPGNAINISSRMGSTRRFTGCAYVYMKFKLTGNSKKTESPFAQQVPTRMTIVGEGIPCYDARQDSTRGGVGAHRAEDQATWTYGDHARNPACQLATYMLGWRIQNPQSLTWKLSVGAGTPPDRIDWASFIEAANLCDEPVTLAAGGTEPRYRGDGLMSEAIDPIEVADAFKATMSADLDDQDGLIRLTVFHNDLATPDADFDTADVEDEYQWVQTPPANEGFNVVRGTYIEPDPKSLYQPAPYREVSLPSASAIERPHPADFGMVQSKSQAERLAKQRLQRQQYGGTFRATFLAAGWKVHKNSVVRLTFEPEGWVNKLFRVAEYEGARVDGRVPMVLREEHADIYAWDAEEGPAVQIAEPTEYAAGDAPFAQFLGTVAEGATAGATTGIDLWDGGGQVLTDAHIKTELGTAAGIAGQGDLATKNEIAIDFQKAQSWVRSDSAQVTISGSNAVKDATVGWTARADGPVLASNGFMQFRPEILATADFHRQMTGFSSLLDRGAGGASTSISGVYFLSKDDYRIVNHDGTLVAKGAYVGTDVFSLFWSNGEVRVYRNSTLAGTATTGGAATMRPVFAPYDGNVDVFEMRCGPYDARIEAAVKGLALDGKVSSGLNDLDRIAESATKKHAAETGANVTETRTAAAITEQGALATKSAVDLTTAEVLNKSLANLDATANTKLGGIEAGATLGATWGTNVGARPAALTELVDVAGTLRLRGDYLTHPTIAATIADRWPDELGSNKTETRTAAAIASQSPWATYATITPTTMANRTQRLDNTSGNLASLDYVTTKNLSQLGGRAWTNLYRADGVTAITDAAAITSLGTAAAIVSQGSLATKNAVDLTTAEVANKSLANLDATANTKLGGIAAGATVGGAFGVNLLESGGGASATLANFKTALGVAASIAGQGTMATLNRATVANLPPVNYSNLIPNASFQTGDLANWGLVGSGQSVVARGTAGVPAGAPSPFVAKFVGNGGTQTIASHGLHVTVSDATVGIAAKAGESYRCSVDYACEAGFGGAMTLYCWVWYADGTNGSAGNISLHDVSTAWQNKSFNVAMPANVVRAQLYLARTGSAGNVYLTNFSATRRADSDLLIDNSVHLSRHVTRADGVTSLTDALAVTSLGTAAAIASQSPWATYATITPTTMANRTQRLDNTSGNLASLDYVTTKNLSQLGGRAWTNLFRANGSTAITDADAITSLGTAAAIASQGALATKSAVDLATAEVLNKSLANVDATANTKLGGIEAGATVGGVFGTNILEAGGGVTATLSNFKTSLGTASAITGQAPAATDSSIEAAADLTLWATGKVAETLTSNSDGTWPAGILPHLIDYDLVSRAGSYTTGVTWAVTKKSGTGGATISTVSDKGRLSINSLDSSCVFEITATVGGQIRGRAVLSVEKYVPPPSSGGTGSGSGTSGSITLSGQTTTTTHVQLGSTVTVKAGSNGLITVADQVFYNVPTGNVLQSTTGYGKAQWRVPGGTWADIAAEQQGSAATSDGEGFPNETGVLNFSQQKTGLTNGNDYEIRFLARSDAVESINWSGSISVTGT